LATSLGAQTRLGSDGSHPTFSGSAFCAP
jgi:hypothetical protein